MSDTLREQQLFRQRAGQDIADIEALASTPAFGRYWMRRLQDKHALAEKSFKYDVLSPEDREAKRQQMLAFEELRDMASKDRVACQKILESAAPVPGQRPMQAG